MQVIGRTAVCKLAAVAVFIMKDIPGSVRCCCLDCDRCCCQSVAWRRYRGKLLFRIENRDISGGEAVGIYMIATSKFWVTETSNFVVGDYIESVDARVRDAWPVPRVTFAFVHINLRTFHLPLQPRSQTRLLLRSYLWLMQLTIVID